MTTRTSRRWKSLPGNFDRLHTFALFESDNAYGIPVVKKETWVPDWLRPYGERIRTADLPANGAMHFFLDDYKFEVVWNRPLETLSAPKTAGKALSPMFSVYHNWPLALQIFNTYRNRWMQCYWQMHGIEVIPTLAWGTPETYDFCFAGIPRGCTVAATMLGVSDVESRKIYRDGYFEMIDRIAPEHVVFYGQKMPEEMKKLAPVSFFPTRWDSIRATKSWLKNKSTE